jgi:polar amino acid transport system substrate-binding protein
MKPIRKALILGTAFLLLASAQALADLKIGVASEPYPPFTSKDSSGKWVGWEMDFLEALCTQIKEKCDITETAWDGIIPALMAKKIDVIVASMSKTAKRREMINFSDTYYSAAPMMIGAKTGDMNIASDHLAGKTIGVQVSTIHAAYVDKYFAKTATVKTYATQDEANQDLAAGRIDYVLANGLALDSFLKSEQGGCCESKGSVPADDVILGEGVGTGLRKEDTELATKINQAISVLAANGILEKISVKHGLKGQVITPGK